MIKVTRGIVPRAKKVVVYGPEGIGKSTFAAQFPDAIIIDVEGSTASMDVARIEPKSWSELLSNVKDITAGLVDVPCRTLVIDTADWAETLCTASVCAQNHWDSLSSPSYGTGYRVAWEEFGKLMNELSTTVDKGINVVVTAHAAMRKFEQPDEAGSYDRWEMKLQNSPKANIAAMVKEWADMVLFVNYKTIVSDKDKQGKGKAQGGRRVMYTEHHPCWDAKNRYGLPAMMDFTYEGIRQIIEGQGAPQSTPQTAPAPMPAPTPAPALAPATPKVETAKSDMYYMRGDEFIKVAKGEAVPDLTGAVKITKREFDAKKALNAPHEEVKPEPAKAPEKPAEVVKAIKESIDPAIPEKVRRLMEQYSTTEWDIQNVVSMKGYMPYDMPVKDYPMDFVEGWLIPYFGKVAEMAEQIKDKAEIPFN
jgi:hypothetical protein